MISTDLHRQLNAQWTQVSGEAVPAHYGSVQQEHQCLHTTAGALDLSYRARLCVVGSDRQRFVNGQVTNNVNALQPGEGCYAALVTAKGKMVSDLNIHVLPDEILLDFEPGLSSGIAQRLEKYIISEDVQIMDVASNYGLLTIQGPEAPAVVRRLELGPSLPAKFMHHVRHADTAWGELYLVNQPRLGSAGYDLYAPVASFAALFEKIASETRSAGGGPCGWQALELARIEAGIPRFGADMDESNLPPEAGLESTAISYDKGCYIGQEVISRIRAYGQVARALRGLRLADDLEGLPVKGDKLFKDGKEAGYITSAVASPRLQANIALGYVRRETNAIGARLILRSGAGEESQAQVVELPFTLP